MKQMLKVQIINDIVSYRKNNKNKRYHIFEC